MAVFAKDGIEVQNLLLDKPELVDPPETILEEEIHGETDAQKKQKVKNQENRIGCKTDVKKHKKKQYCAIQSHGSKRNQR